MRAGLFQHQSLKLTMTKELSQAIALLQYSSLELVTFLQEQALENPLIEMDEYEPTLQMTKPKKTTEKKSENNNWIENVSKSTETLQEHLAIELSFLPLSSYQRKIVEYINNNLDEGGYLRLSNEELAEQLTAPITEIEAAVSIVQNLDPPGVGARSLQECILLQLTKLGERNVVAETIIKEHFQLFAQKAFTKLAKELRIGVQEIQAIYDFIQTLQPRPGFAFQNEKPAYVIPDLSVEIVGKKCVVTVNDEYMPKLNAHYENFLQKNDNQLQSFLHDRYQQYQWLIKSLQQRKQTLIRVMNEIINKQPDFFTKGAAYLKPLTMREIAEPLEIHESTVSRAVKGKYIQTPFGILAMKDFFSSKLQDDTSSAQVKQSIEALIQEENKQKPLSDKKIADLLEKDQGIIVSRRTIAKYRDQLGILPSSKRKRYDTERQD